MPDGWTPREPPARLHPAFGLAAALLAGAACVPVAVIVGQLEQKYMLAALAGAAGLVGLGLLGSLARVRLVMVMALATGLSIGLSISFLHQTEIPGRYTPFVGGALAVTVSLAFIGALGWLLAAMAEAWLYGRAFRLRLVPLIVMPQLLFMAAGLLSLVNAMHPVLTWLEQLRLSTLLLITVVVMNLSPRELKVYVWTLALSIVPQFLLSAVQFATGRTLGLGVLGEQKLIRMAVDFAQVTRPGGTFGDPNVLSYFFEISFPLGLALLLLARRPLAQLGGLAATVSGIGGMIASYSRAAWLTIPVSTTVLLVSILGRRALSLRMAMLAVTGAAAAFGALVWIWPLIERRLFGDDAGSASHRLPLARAALSIFEQFPVIGVGLNNFAVSFGTYDRTGYSRVFLGGDHVVHNLHLLVLTETGLLGYAAFLFQFIGAWIVARRIRQDTVTRGLAVAACAGFLAHLMHGMVDPGYKLSLTVSHLVVAQLGLVGALWLHDRDTLPVPPRDRA